MFGQKKNEIIKKYKNKFLKKISQKKELLQQKQYKFNEK
jgi:hypothetical protein